MGSSCVGDLLLEGRSNCYDSKAEDARQSVHHEGALWRITSLEGRKEGVREPDQPKSSSSKSAQKTSIIEATSLVSQSVRPYRVRISREA